MSISKAMTRWKRDKAFQTLMHMTSLTSSARSKIRCTSSRRPFETPVRFVGPGELAGCE